MADEKTKAEDFLLPAEMIGDDLMFRAPARKNNLVEPLIDGIEIFKAMEEAISAAQHTVFLAFWAINATTNLLSDKAKSAHNVRTWGAFLGKLAQERNVQVRIFSSDFDPIAINHGHQRAWRQFGQFVKEAKRRNLSKDQFQVMCGLHEAAVKSNFLVEYMLKGMLKDIVRYLNSKGESQRIMEFKNSPGLWENVHFDKSTKKLKLSSKLNLKASPATHHLKYCVIDRRIAFVGGLNVSSYYFDNQRHNKKQNPVHDVFCRVEGDVVDDIERSFIGHWNNELPHFEAFIKFANAIQPPFKISVLKTTNLKSSSLKTPKRSGKGIVQLLRTLSQNIPSSTLVPTPIRTDIEEAYKNAIEHARHFIYIENQYLRYFDIATWLISRQRSVRNLQVIIVTPVESEEIQEGKRDEATMHGAYLEEEVSKRLQNALGKNVGIYSLVQKSKTPPSHKVTSSYGSPRIYIHSKILIVDDVFASIGSANTNPRSFKMDTELALGWYDISEAEVRKFRLRLWNELLGSPNGMSKWKTNEFVKKWETIAHLNAKAQPNKRQGFIIPPDPKKIKGRQSYVLPDEYVEFNQHEKGVVIV